MDNKTKKEPEFEGTNNIEIQSRKQIISIIISVAIKKFVSLLKNSPARYISDASMP